MTRTRVVFFGFVALFLALMVFGLLGQGLSEQFMRQLFVATSIFAAGVVLLDLFGLLGHHATDAQDAGGATGTTAGHVADGGGGHAAHLDQAGDGPAAGHAAVAGHDASVSAASGHAAGHAAHATHAQNAHAQDESQLSQGLLSALVYLRLLVYFCLGFGPIGWAAMATGWSALRALAFAAPVGVVAVFLAQAFFRFQRKDTNSQIAPAELVAHDAVVLVPLDDKSMGKVRVKVGPTVNDVYALASEAGRTYERGEPVRIERVTDECVYVR